ncbi:MAG TPA: hypothetical protein VMQ67_02975 [Candidatus Saccharimonadales bacterium]|jgi:hypothetical protein|nr:hypothetical protein [Candidatus Saccharimonadales bacterium]
MSQIIDLRMGSCSPVATASGEASFEFSLIRPFQKKDHRLCSWQDASVRSFTGSARQGSTINH